MINGRTWILSAACGAGLTVFGTQPAVAQGVWIAGGGIGFIEHRVNAGYGRERFGGLALEFDLERRFGSRLVVRVRGLGAELQATATGDLDRRLGEAEANARFAVTPIWGVYGGVSLRAVSSDAGRQHWVFGRIGAEVRPAFTGNRLHAVGRLGLIPFAAVRGLSSASITLDGAVGVDYERNRLTLGLLYAVERFAFTSVGAVDRAEQLSRLTLRAGIRMSRRP